MTEGATHVEIINLWNTFFLGKRLKAVVMWEDFWYITETADPLRMFYRIKAEHGYTVKILWEYQKLR